MDSHFTMHYSKGLTVLFVSYGNRVQTPHFGFQLPWLLQGVRVVESVLWTRTSWGFINTWYHGGNLPLQEVGGLPGRLVRIERGSSRLCVCVCVWKERRDLVLCMDLFRGQEHDNSDRKYHWRFGYRGWSISGQFYKYLSIYEGDAIFSFVTPMSHG